MLTPIRIKINRMYRPMGLDVGHQPVLVTWNIREYAYQKAYRVVAEGSLGTRYDSGVLESAAMEHRIPAKFLPRERVTVIVYAWEQKAFSGESEEEDTGVTYFELGLSSADWTAQWIDPELTTECEQRYVKQKDCPKRPGSYLRKTFSMEKLPDEETPLRLYITCHGVYHVRINGHDVESFEMAPGTSRYWELLPYQTYDVRRYLQTGENEIVVSLADGWWRGVVTYDGVANTFGCRLSLLAQLEAGGKVVVRTAETWEASQEGPLRFADNMSGEIYDARRENITGWHAVRPEDFGYENLQGRILPPPLVHETFTPKLLVTPQGDKVLDFGQNIAGVMSFETDAREGDCFTFVHGETLDGDGNFTIEHFQSMNFRCAQQITYYAKEGKNRFRPHHTFMGFRYVKVEGMEHINPADFKAHAIYTDLEVTAAFTCSNPLVNRLFVNSLWSLKGNLLDAPTDCPTREKSAFTGDFEAYIHTFLYFMDGWPMVQKFLECQKAGQFEDGCVRQIVCDAMERSAIDGAAGWSNSFEILPMAVLKTYGDLSMAERLYENLNRWVDYCLAKAAGSTREQNLENPWHPWLYDSGFHWGEWLEPNWDFEAYMKDIQINGKPEEATAYLAEACETLSVFAERLDKSFDAAYYRENAENAKKAYRYAFTEDGRIHSNHMCRYVRPILLNLITEEEKRQAAADLNDLVIKNGYHLNTGFLTTHALCRTLSDYGYSETAYRLLLQEDCPGWLYSVKCGATTIPEGWEAYQPDGGRKDSFNHYSYGAVSSWLLDSVAGIRAEDGKVTITPKPSPQLAFADGTWLSPYGKLRCAWKHEEDGRVSYEIEVPGNVTAVFVGADGEQQELAPGKYFLQEKRAE